MAASTARYLEIPYFPAVSAKFILSSPGPRMSTAIIAPRDDPEIQEYIRDCYNRNVTNRVIIAKLIKDVFNCTRRAKDMNLKANDTKDLTEQQKRQIVADQMGKDPSGRQGPRRIKELITFNTGTRLTRDAVSAEMRIIDPEGFSLREPTSKKIHRGVLTSIGPNHEWSADGHDKLVRIGFAIWGVRDKWSGKWLGLWVIPNNRLKVAIAYLYLSLVAKLGGMPLQSTTDRGSETTLLYGFATALREHFSPELEAVELGPAHQFLKSTSNITIERGWLGLRITWGDNVHIHWEAGQDIYDSAIPQQYELVQWLWPKLLQQDLDLWRRNQNDHKGRSMRNKLLPSGVSPNIAYQLPHDYNGENQLQKVQVDVLHQLMEEIGGEALIRFVTPEYARRAQAVYDSLQISSLSYENVWFIFQAMLPYM
ncbi:hypothetical protein H0H93_003660 [Arthromyces matolae]|nr:hypothetical protein H0H93_003660 [Arthromyces matolae]